jgi:hypothetical protein
MGTLAQQLSRLARGEPPRQGSKPSLLYDAQQAADTDVATIYQLALSGETGGIVGTPRACNRPPGG